MSQYEFAKLAMETAGLVASLITFFRTKSKLREANQLLEFIERAYQFTPSTFLEVIKEHSQNLLNENFINFRENEHEIQVTGFFKGVVDTAKPIRSALRKEKQLVSTKLKSLPLYSNTQMVDGRDHIVKYNHADNFVLKDPRTLNTVVVSNSRHCPNHMAFTKIGEKSEFRSFNWIEMVVTRVIWLIQLCFGIFKIYPSFKGFLMGVKTTEQGVEIGQSILAFGRLRFDKLTKNLAMDHPMFLMSDKTQMTDFHISERQRWGRVRNFSLILSVTFALLVIRRLYKMGRKIVEKIQLAVERFKLRKFKQYSEFLGDEFKCIICIENPKNIIFKPCLHMAMCKTCFASLPKQECPVCKTPIKSTVSVFLV